MSAGYIHHLNLYAMEFLKDHVWDLLFLIYISDLPLVIKNTKPSISADDPGIMAGSDSFPRLKNLIQEDIQSLVTWLANNLHQMS